MSLLHVVIDLALGGAYEFPTKTSAPGGSENTLMRCEVPLAMVAQPAIDSGRRHAGSGAGHERGPSVHQTAPLVEQIASRVAPFDSPTDHVCKGHLRHVPCRPGPLRGPRAETRPEAVRHGRDLKDAQQDLLQAAA